MGNAVSQKTGSNLKTALINKTSSELSFTYERPDHLKQKFAKNGAWACFYMTQETGISGNFQMCSSARFGLALFYNVPCFHTMSGVTLTLKFISRKTLLTT